MNVASEADGDTCRICRSGAEDGAPLFHPCKCQGSIRSCHQACLIEWLQHSKKKYCELCNHSYVFHKRYKSSMPSGQLPWRHYARRLLLRVLQGTNYLFRAILCILAWLVFLPLVNIYTLRGLLWTAVGLLRLGGSRSIAGHLPDGTATAIAKSAAAKAASVQSTTETAAAAASLADNLPLPLPKFVLALAEPYLPVIDSLMRDCFEGQILSCIVLVVFVGIFLLREWVLQHIPQAPEPAEPAQEARDGAAGVAAEPAPLPAGDVVAGTAEQAADGPEQLPQDDQPDLEVMRRRRLQRFGLDVVNEATNAVPGAAPPVTDAVPGAAPQATNAEDAPDALPALVAEPHLFDDLRQPDALSSDHEYLDDGSNNTTAEEGDAWEDVTSDGEGGAPVHVADLFQRRILNIDGPNGLRLAQEVPINGANEDGHPDEMLDDEEWEEAEDMIAWEDELLGIFEAIGLHGPITGLLQNLALITVLSTFALLVFGAVPFSVGRLLGTGDNLVALAQLPVRALRVVTDPFFDGVISMFMMAVRATLAPLRSQKPVSHVSKQILSSTQLIDPTASTSQAPALARVLAQASSQVQTSFWRLHAALNARIYGSKSTDHAIAIVFGHFYEVIALLTQQQVVRYFKLDPNWHWAQSYIDESLIMVKVGCFIAIELVLFPLGCGFLLDACTLPLVRATIADRVSSLSAAPVTVLFVHWVVGTLWMFLFAQFVSLTRDIARPGVMCWIRDPHDPNFQPVKEILERKSLTQLGKIGTSVLMYGAVSIGTVGIPCKLAQLALSNALPLQDANTDSSTYSLLDLVAILIITPWLIRKAKPSRLTRRLYSRWWKFAAAALRLSSFLRGGRHRREEGASSAADGHETQDDRAGQLVGTGPATGSFARVPADNHAVMSTPLVIRTDANGVPYDEEGRSAIRMQHAAISKATVDKPKYTIVYVPPNFRLRLWAFVGSLWLSSAAFVTICTAVPFLLGRLFMLRVLDERAPHGGRAFYIGACIALALLAGARGIFKAVRGEQPREDADGAQIVAIEYDSPLWKRLADPFVEWLSHAAVVRLTMPLLFGLVFQQYVTVPALFGLRHNAPTVSLLEAWGVGTMVQKVVLYSVTDEQYDAWKNQRVPFFSLVCSLAAALAAPPMVCTLVIYGARIDLSVTNGQAPRSKRGSYEPCGPPPWGR